MAGPKFKIGSLRVTSVEGDAVTLRITARASGSFTWACDGDRRCFTSMVGATEYAPAMGRITGHPGAKITTNKIMVRVVSAASGTAILRLDPV